MMVNFGCHLDEQGRGVGGEGQGPLGSLWGVIFIMLMGEKACFDSRWD